MKNITLLLLFVFILIYTSHVFSQLTVFSPVSSDELVDSLLGENITLTNNYLIGGEFPSGIFQNTDTMSFEFKSGILLTSGKAINAIGPNSSSATGFNLQFYGDPLLEDLVDTNTYDVCGLTLDFIPGNDLILFKVVFGSEEFPEFINDYTNDVCGFFIYGENPNGGNYNFDNFSLIPGSSLPLTVNNIFDQSNENFYIDNENGQILEYDGYTIPFYVYSYVNPNSSYVVKILIADVFDHLVDSGVFIEGKSFSSMSSKTFVEFSIKQSLNPTFPYDIIGEITNDSILLHVPNNIDLSEVVPSFSLPPGSVASSNSVIQISDTSIQNLNNPVTYTITNEIQSSNDWKVVPFFTSNFDEENEISVSISPNPVTNLLYVKNAKNCKLIIYSINGEEINSINIPNNNFSINISSIESGYYFIKVFGRSISFTEKLIINN